MANDEDPTRVSILATVVMIALGLFLGSTHHLVYVRYTGDKSHSAVVAAAIPVTMLVLGVWFTTWTMRKSLLNWFPLAIGVLCFGLGGLFL